MTLHPLDWLVIGGYFATVFSIALFLVKKPKSSEDYFLANRQLSWPFIGASLFAANISAEHFVGLAGAGFATGMAAGGFEWMAVFCLAPLVFLFLPFYIRNKIYTVPEFLEKRFNSSVRLTFSAFMMVLSVLAKISISLWASSIVFSTMLGWNQTTVIWVVGLFTALYTMKGGLSVVVYTDALQTLVLLVAACILTGVGLHHVGGWTGLHAKLGPEMFSMVKPATHPDYPWPGMFIGVFLLGSFYWSMDQVLVQRVFAARTLNEGRLGAVFCGFLKVTTPFLLILPGLIAKALYPDIPKADDAYPTLLVGLMPTGLLGLTIAGIAAALMGHISATYNSVSTLFTRDFYLHWYPEASQERQIFVGRIAVLVIFVFGALWAPVIGHFKSLFIYLQTVQAYLMMPFAGIFFLGVLWKRTTSAGVLACVASALLICPVFIYNGQLMSSHVSPILPFMNHPLLRPWLHGAMVACGLCMLVLVAVSLLTTPTPANRLASTTLNFSPAKTVAPCEMEPAPARSFFNNYQMWLAAVFALVAFLWWRMQ
jgi:SSS family solute:Na+ symporter